MGDGVSVVRWNNQVAAAAACGGNALHRARGILLASGVSMISSVIVAGVVVKVESDDKNHVF